MKKNYKYFIILITIFLGVGLLSGKANSADGDTVDNIFYFGVIGDTQRYVSSDGNFPKAVRFLEGEKVDLVMAVGDLVSSCDGGKECETRFTTWKNVLGDLMGRTYAAQGNHDRSKGKKSDKMWQKVFDFPANGPEGLEELVYSFDYENSHFVVLASENPKEHKISSTQLKWLEDDLRNNTKEHTFVFFHEPAFPVSSKRGSSLDAQEEERDALWKILSQHKVTAVFNGHEHIHSRKKVDGVYQFVFGNTESYDHKMPKEGRADYAYQGATVGIVEINGSEVTVHVFTVEGELVNSFQIPK